MDIQLVGKTLKPAGYTYIIPSTGPEVDGDISKSYNSKDKTKKPINIFKTFNIYLYSFEKKLKKFNLDCNRVKVSSDYYLFMFKFGNKLFLMAHKKKGKEVKKVFTGKDVIIKGINKEYIKKCKKPIIMTTPIYTSPIKKKKKSPEIIFIKESFDTDRFKLKIMNVNMYKKRKIAYTQILKDVFDNKPNRKIHTADLKKIFKIYDDVYFNGFIGKTIKDKGYKFTLEMSGRLTSSAGNCFCSSLSGKCNCEYKIKLSKKIFNDVIFQTDDDKRKANGIICINRLDCLLLTFEHELVHLITYMFYNKGGHDDLFKGIVKNLFGQTDIRHDLFQELEGDVPEMDYTKVRVGDYVTFIGRKRHTKERYTIEGKVIKVNPVKFKVKSNDGTSWNVRKTSIKSHTKKKKEKSPIITELSPSTIKISKPITIDISDFYERTERTSKKVDYTKISVGDYVTFGNKEGKVIKINPKRFKVEVGDDVWNVYKENVTKVSKRKSTSISRDKGSFSVEDVEIGDCVLFKYKNDESTGIIVNFGRKHLTVFADDGRDYTISKSTIKAILYKGCDKSRSRANKSINASKNVKTGDIIKFYSGGRGYKGKVTSVANKTVKVVILHKDGRESNTTKRPNKDNIIEILSGT